MLATAAVAMATGRVYAGGGDAFTAPRVYGERRIVVGLITILALRNDVMRFFF